MNGQPSSPIRENSSSTATGSANSRGGRKNLAGSALLLTLSLGLASSAFALGDGKVHVYACEVGQGSGSIIIGPTGLSCLADGGANNTIAANLIEAMNDAIAAGLTDATLDYSIVSHLHTDHLSAMDEVLAAFPGGLIAAYDRTGTYSSTAFTNYNNAYGSKRATPVSFDMGGGATFTYLGRGGGTSADENTFGVIYRLDFGNFQGWFGGDLGKGYEAALGAICGPVEFYHCDHHGSSTSSEAAFLPYITPKVTVVSYGVGNSYGHPTADAMARLASIGTARYDTPYDKNAAGPYVLVESDGVSATFTANGTAYPTWEGGGAPTPSPTAAPSPSPTAAPTATPLPTASPTPSPSPSPTPSPSPSPVPPPSVWINEIHYDNSSTDSNEGVEVAGPSALSLTGYKILGYNGSGGVVYSTTNLSGSFTNQQGGYGTKNFLIAGLQNDVDGIALVSPTGAVLEFISYEGSFVAADGAAAGMTSTDIVKFEAGTLSGKSLQRQGTGHGASAFTWSGEITATRGSKNTSQTFQ